MWKIIDTGKQSAQTNMAFDVSLLKGLTSLSPPILHFYDWNGPSITYGYFIQPKKVLCWEKLQKRGVDLARRPTGGGVIFHSFDMAFSAIVPSHSSFFSLDSIANYKRINDRVRKAVETLLEDSSLCLLPEKIEEPPSSCRDFCMSHPSRYDVMIHGKKVAGAAQRRIKNGYLHQGSISITPLDDEFLEDVLPPGSPVLATMKKTSFPLLSSLTTKDLVDVRRMLKRELIHWFTKK